jgi:D-alanyl-D-alanine carboxypeptidase (penicillin-binding protein 5/6)
VTAPQSPATSPDGEQHAAAPNPTHAPTKKPAPKSDGSIAVTVSANPKIPGSKPRMPWPRTGQAAIALSGTDVIGVSGRQTAVPTASMAKAMTAYIVLRDHPLKPGEDGPTITVTRAEAAVLSLNIRQAQAVIPVRAGEKLTQRQAMQALMLKSANNVARILARWDAGSVPAFLKKMNATAKSLGMTDTHYTDPSGWHADTVSTVTDQIRLAEAAMRRDDFADLVGTKSAWVPLAGRVRNVNILLGQAGIVGIKTGSMSAAGGCLLFAAKATVDHRTVTIVGTVMAQRSNVIGDLHQAFASSKSLVLAMRDVIGTHTVIKKGQVVASVPGTKSHLVATKTITVVGWSGMKYHTRVTATVPHGAKAGAKVGTLTVSGAGTTTIPVTLK